MLEMKRTSPIIALIGAVALLSSAPAAMAQTPAPTPATASADTAAPAAPAATDQGSEGAEGLKVGGSQAGHLTPIGMFVQADLVVKIVMIGLLACSILSWTLLII